jgi:AAA15 family ATPase/GTPase
MNLLNNIKIKNFKCFRTQTKIPLSQGSYLIGINNAGKTAILNAINFFFDNSTYSDDIFLNRTEYLAKKAGYNRSEIAIYFDLNNIDSVALKRKLLKTFGSEAGLVEVKKNITFTPDSKKMSFSYEINGNDPVDYDDLDPDIRKLLESIKITYIHPQEGKELLLKAQAKLKERLLANWGRNAKLSHSIKELQEKWNILRGQAHTYLSTSLTESLQKMWPGSQAAIDLPKDIKEIVGISDINFKSNSILPEIELTSQGTGAQTAILYLAHYLLDSDRSLHRGEYHPIWLLEEPESFLHADLILKFADDINSNTWLKNIQMVISTHSAILLAASRLGGENVTWNFIQNYSLKGSKKVDKWSEEEIENIGHVMGDANFHAYFSASKDYKLVFIEDKKEITKVKFEEAGIKIEKNLDGVSQIAKYIDVFLGNPELIRQKAYFIVDNDEGIKDLKRFLTKPPEKSINGFKLFKIGNTDKVYIILLPEKFSVEDLFDEYDNFLDNCVAAIWDTNNWSIKPTIPRHLSRICSSARSKNNIDSIEAAKELIRNETDVKDPFWKKVVDSNLQMNQEKLKDVKSILN